MVVPEGQDDAITVREYLRQTQDLLASIKIEEVIRVVDVLRAARRRGATVFIIGNGGSAAGASHFATDLTKASRRSHGPPLRVTSLTDNAALMTAASNDEGYDRVFVSQLEGLLREEDVVVAISASGRSPNVLAAVEFVRQRRAISVALVGFDGGELLGCADHAVHIRSAAGAYGPVEDALLAVHHSIAECLVLA